MLRRWQTLLLLAGTLLTAATFGQSGSSPEIRVRILTLTDMTQIHLLEAGHRTSAPALVFIPGWTLPASLWNQQIKKFSTDRLVIAVDGRSQGDSSKTELGNTPEQRAKDLREVLSILHVSSAVLIGWSQGSQDVAAYIQQFGTGSLAGVVFVDSPVAAGPSEIEENKEWSQQFLRMLAVYVNHPAEYSEGMVRSIFKRPHPELNLQDVIAHSRKTHVTTGVTMLIMDIFAVDRRPALAKIDKPTLVIASAESPLLRAQEKMAAAISGAKFVSVKGSGHALFVDDPEEFNSSLERLLRSISAK
jgi:microsomal epoxide hydrolase